MRVPSGIALAIFVVACTGERVGEEAVDAAASGGGQSGSGGTAGAVGGSGGSAGISDPDAGAGPVVLADGRDCPADLRVSAGALTWVDQGSLQNSAQDGVVATMPAAGCGTDAGSCITILASDQNSPS